MRAPAKHAIAGVIFMRKEYPDAAHELRDPKVPPVRGTSTDANAEASVPTGNQPRA